MKKFVPVNLENKTVVGFNSNNIVYYVHTPDADDKVQVFHLGGGMYPLSGAAAKEFLKQIRKR